MPSNPDVIVRVEDVHGDLIAEASDILFSNTRTSGLVRKTVPKGKSLSISGLSQGPMEVYKAEVDPPSYLRVSSFIAATAGAKQSVKFVVPADPTKAVPEFRAFGDVGPDCCGLLERSTAVLGHTGKKGSDLFGSLDPLQRAGFLNIACKSEFTLLPDSRTVLSYLREVYEVRGDRSYFVVDKELREQVKSAATTGAFQKAPDNLHHPPVGYSSAGSWKTDDRYGNLQVTFWAGAVDWRADIDIDDAGGLEHVFQVLRNHLTGLPTHPYAIHQILVKHQKLAPAYRLVPA